MEYKAVVVATDPEEGVLFAKRADSRYEADHIIFDDILRVMEDLAENKVTLENFRDGYGEWVTCVSYGESNKIEYKVCFDDDREVQNDTE